MKRPSFRVFITRHHGGLTSAVLLRSMQRRGDSPPPAAMAESEELALERLLPQALLLVDDPDETRYLWTEPVELGRVEIDIHPGRPDPHGQVIAAASVPIRLAYGATRIPGSQLHRILLPRFDWSFVTEDLATVGPTVRSLVFAILLGERPVSLYDLRREASEHIIEWRPAQAQRRRGGAAEDEPERVPVLEAIAEDWVAQARAGRLAPTVGQDPRYDELDKLLDERRLPSLLLVGPRGAGKTTLVRRLARGLLERSRGKDGVRRRLWGTSAGRIVAGMAYLGMWQQRCLGLVAALDDSGDVLHVDRLADLMAPIDGTSAISDLLAPAVVAGRLSLVAEADEAELVRARQRHPALVDALRIVRVPEASPAEVMALLEPYGHRTTPPVGLTAPASRRLVELLAAFRRDTAFPGKALRFIDHLAERPQAQALGLGELTRAFAAWSGLPLGLLSPESSWDTGSIVRELQAGVVGQDQACQVAARVIARLKAGLDDPERPVGALMLAGPTGVGKTELAKQLARTLFGSAERLIRVDMSEMGSPAAIASLISPSPAGTSLADRLRREPLSVVLFDELEKASPAAFDLLLGVLGEGRLTDAHGRLVDLRMAIIVMTTNLGAGEAAPAGFGRQAGADHVGAIRRFFRPELLGRLDVIVPFAPLGLASLERIVDLELAKVGKRPGLVARNLRLDCSPAARRRLAELGHDPRLGARPLRRTIEDLVVAPLAERMASQPTWGGATVRLRTAAEGGGDVTVG